MNNFMSEAIKEARLAINNGDGGPFGAVIVKNNSIVGRGHNMVINQKDPTMHAEIAAIKSACKNLNTFDLKGCKLYVTAQPCPMCLFAAAWANIDEIYYGCTKTDTDNIGFRDEIFYKSVNNDDIIKAYNIDREECLKVFSEYKKIKNKTHY